MASGAGAGGDAGASAAGARAEAGGASPETDAGSAGANATGGFGGDPGGAGMGAQAGFEQGAGTGGAAGGAPPHGNPACPEYRPQMSDPCVGDLVCTGYSSINCSYTASCRMGRWKLEAVNNGVCNPPSPCPDEEPSPQASSCPHNNFSDSGCRYPRATCFAYLSCTRGYTVGVGPHWVSIGGTSQIADSCCPATEPTAGAACSDDDILCGYGAPKHELLCAAGVWKTVGDGWGGGGGTGGTGGSGGTDSGAGGSPPTPGGAGGHPPDTTCPAFIPQMDDPCVGDLVCKPYQAGVNCGSSSAICKNGRWKIVIDGFCNPPPPCPDAEPDPEAATCPMSGFDVGADCRYARSTCFSYLSCRSTASVPGVDPVAWTSAHPQAKYATDSCCPATQPAAGDACSEEAILCGWGDPRVELVCRNGTWVPRAQP